MTDETSTAPPQGTRPGGSRDSGGSRESGGFRIRLSDNEMRAARALQDAFRLRSTVAVLGFSVRALAQLLEEGKLDELVAQQRSQAASPAPNRDGAREGGRGRRPNGDGESRGGRPERAARVDPFARPARPTPAEPVPAEPIPSEPEASASETPAADAPAADGPAADGADPSNATPAES